jgi:tellurite resistance protein TehA-like permease
MLYGCYAMFGLSLVASLNIIAMIWSRLTLYGTSGSARVPTLWIVLGPLGQSITAAGLLGATAAIAVHDIAENMNAFAILYGVPVWGFAVLWIALAASLTVRTLWRGMPFALTWWSLTFPVGTFVTGTAQLAAHTHLPAFKVGAAIAYAALLFTWLLVGVRTARGSLRGNLMKVPPSTAPVKASKDSVARLIGSRQKGVSVGFVPSSECRVLMPGPDFRGVLQPWATANSLQRGLGSVDICESSWI